MLIQEVPQNPKIFCPKKLQKFEIWEEKPYRQQQRAKTAKNVATLTLKHPSLSSKIICNTSQTPVLQQNEKLENLLVFRNFQNSGKRKKSLGICIGK